MEQIDSLETKKRYKKTEIGEIPVDWEIKKVGDICDLGRGRVISQEEINSNPGHYPVFSSQSKDQGIMGFINSYDFDGEFVTWTTDGAYAGTVFYRSSKFNCTNVCGILQKRVNFIDMKYISFILQRTAKKHVVQCGNPKLMNNIMAQIFIPNPPLPEQKKIAEILSCVDDAIAKKTEIIEKTKELKKGLMQKLLSKDIMGKKCKIVKLKSIVNLINGRAFKPHEWGISGLPIIRIQNLNDLSKPFNYCNFEVPKKYIIYKNDILIAWSGTPGTSFGIHKWKGEKAVLNQHIFKVVFKSFDICEDFFAIIVQYKLDYLIQKAHGGVGLKHVTKNVIDEMEILLPPFPEQKKIADILTAVDGEIESEIKNKEKLENVKKGLMQVLLTGKIRVKNYG